MQSKLRSQAMAESTSSHHRITVGEYYDMARTGLIAPDARVELIEGEVVRMAPIGDRHGCAVEELDELLHRAVAGQARVRCQLPVRLSDYSEPQPDFAIVRPRTGSNDRAHPSAADIFLIVEISDSTLRYDLDVKVPLYARYGVPEVWVVDLKHGRAHFHRSPLEGSYRNTDCVAKGGIAAIPGITGATVDLSGILVE